MRVLSAVVMAAVILLLASQANAAPAPELTINKTGRQGTTLSYVDFEVKNGTLHPVNPIVEVKVDGVVVNAAFNSGPPPCLTITPKLSAGNHTVYIKVQLNNGTTLEKTETVTFP